MKVFFKFAWLSLIIGLLIMLSLSTVSFVYLHILDNVEMAKSLFYLAATIGWILIPIFIGLGMFWTVYSLLMEQR